MTLPLMRHAIFILLLLLTLTEDPAWTTFTPKDGSFSARFPQTPSERATRTGTVWMYSAKDKVYNVAKSPLEGGESASPGQITAALDAVRDNIVKRVQAKLISERKLLHDNLPAREFLFELPEEKGQLRLRCLAAKGQVWEIKVGGPKDYVTGKEAETFLTSLKIK
jgi:hypothetical protein